MDLVSNKKIDNIYRYIARKTGGDVKRLVRYLVGKRTMSHNDLLWEIRPADNHTDYTMWLKGTSGVEEELAYLSKLYSGKDMVIVDIGANIGLYSVFLSSITGKNSRIFSFEPNPRMRERLARNIALNNIENIDVFPYAVGAEAGELELNFPSRWNSGQASLVLKPRVSNSSIRVEVRPLIDVLPDDIKVDFIKIDIEGAEDRALIPYLQTLPKEKYPEHIFLEHVHSDFWEQDLRAFLLNLGYAVSYQTSANTLFSINLQSS